MANCELCHKQALDEQSLNEAGNHIICEDEFTKRENANMCTRCNKNKIEKWWDICSDCESNNSDFQGYEGPK